MNAARLTLHRFFRHTVGLVLALTSLAASRPIRLPATGSSPLNPGNGGRLLRAGQTPSSLLSELRSGDPAALVATYAPGVLDLRVAQQPPTDLAFVYPALGYATRFALAEAHGSIGLLAHNYLAGAQFFRLLPGQEVNLVYGDGRVSRWVVTSVRRFRALEPDNPYSSFQELEADGPQLSSTELFYQVYRARDRLVFQTCIESGGMPAWGRLFVIAERDSEDPAPGDATWLGTLPVRLFRTAERQRRLPAEDLLGGPPGPGASPARRPYSMPVFSGNWIGVATTMMR